MQKKIILNPYYVSRLVGPLALASEMDMCGNLLESIDYTDPFQRNLVFNCLIQPEFDRLGDTTKHEVKKSLGFFVENPDFRSELIDGKLLLCGVHPEVHKLFLSQLWIALFPSECTDDYIFENCKIINKPLTANQFVFSRPESESLHDGLNKLHEKLLGNL